MRVAGLVEIWLTITVSHWYKTEIVQNDTGCGTMAKSAPVLFPNFHSGNDPTPVDREEESDSYFGHFAS